MLLCWYVMTACEKEYSVLSCYYALSLFLWLLLDSDYYISQGWLAFILYSNARVKDLKVFIMQQVIFQDLVVLQA